MDTQVLITATLKWQHSLIVREIDNSKLDPKKASISWRFKTILNEEKIS